MKKQIFKLSLFLILTCIALLIAFGNFKCTQSSSVNSEAENTNNEGDNNSDDQNNSGTENLTQTEENLLVAFIGDQGYNSSAVAVLNLIKNENANLVIHMGDFDYLDDANLWDNQINATLGTDFPYLSVVGNHDVAAWEDYAEKITNRINQISAITCTGELGVKSTCTYKGLEIVLSGIGSYGSDHETYLNSSLSQSTHLWRICAWHKNQRLMQVGGKSDEVGWQAYETCRQYGAIIATGHEHSYARTHLLSNMENQSIASSNNTLELDLGASFAFVSGLGGKSIRSQDSSIASLPYWASVYTSDQSANYGALFCQFYYDSDPRKAYCYFKDIDGDTIDTFFIQNKIGL